MIRWAIPVVLLAALVASPLVAGPAAAASVNQTLIAKSIAWHVGSETSQTTAIAVNVGDTLHLHIQNAEATATTHTFSAPHFPAVAGQGGGGNFLNLTLPQGATYVWNYTFTATDQGTWQFYCTPHSSGVYPNRAGMTGTFVVSPAGAPPPTPGFETVVVIAALVGVAGAVRFASRRKEK
jgi:FtsP/CotA-like multicopper oxidase with cupredoxin domain